MAQASPPSRSRSRDASTTYVSEYVSEYIQVIRSCFANETIVSPYFFQLIDYIQSDATNNKRLEPTPKAVRIRCLADTTNNSELDQPWGFVLPEGNISQIETPCLITIEGLPSPGCVAYIGRKYDIRPEYWLGNLNFGRQSLTRAQSHFFELPSLPSRRDNIVHVSIPILGRRTVTSGISFATNLSALERLEAKNKVEEWDRQLFQNRKYGATRLRKLHLHNSEYFSIDQLVSFTVCNRAADNWVGIFLVDQGFAVPESVDTPWSKYSRNTRPPHFLPILSYNERIPSSSNVTGTSRESMSSTPNSFHPEDHIRVANDEALTLLRESPFAVLANVLTRAASAWTQILNFVDADIDQYRTLDRSPTADTLSLALEQLRFNFDYLAHAQQALKDNVYLVRGRGSRTWPGNNHFGPGTMGADLVSSLLMDYEYLMGRCTELSSRCDTVSQILADASKAIEARKSLEQTEKINKLTRLAFVFVPLGFISSFFGMNVNSFANNPPIWIYFAVAVPITAITITIIQWQQVLRKVWKEKNAA